MQDYCGQYKNELTLTHGLRLLKELKETEYATAYASNPHELGRLLECEALITVGEIVMHLLSNARPAAYIWIFTDSIIHKWIQSNGRSCCRSNWSTMRWQCTSCH